MTGSYSGKGALSPKDLIHDLDACIKCSACTAQCPVASVNPLFPGPKQVGPDAERLRLEGVRFAADVLDLCTNCKTCQVTCPAGVNITGMILAARRKARTLGGHEADRRYRLRGGILGRAEQLGKLGGVWPGFANALLGRAWIRSWLEKGMGISRNAPLPLYRKRFASAVVQPTLPRAASVQDPKVIYFPGCFATYNDSAAAEAVVRVLQHNGFQVMVPALKCCGVPLTANGRFAAADKNARHNLQVLLPYLQQGLPVITSCPSCGLALKQDYPQIDAPGAELIGGLTYDLFEFLWELHQQDRLRQGFQSTDVRVGYHAPCHLKAQGIGTPAARLLHLIPGLSSQELDAGCCGLSGSYGFKAENYAMALQIGKSLFARVKDGVNGGEFDAIATECGVCQTQITHTTGADCYHPVLILTRAYGL